MSLPVENTEIEDQEKEDKPQEEPVGPPVLLQRKGVRVSIRKPLSVFGC
jgi:hypothetical protein